MEVIVYQIEGKVYRITPVDLNAVPQGVDYKILDNDLMPSHILRNAWKLNGDLVEVDITKGKEVAHEIRREKRDSVMSANLALIEKDAMGIPLKAGESAANSKSQNNQYKKNVDDVAQSEIDNALNEDDLVAALIKMNNQDILPRTSFYQKFIDLLNVKVF